MAKISPCLTTLRHDTGLYREIDVLERLRQSLPDGYEVFHSVTWQAEQQGQDRQHGEIDLVVLAPTGSILLMEVKAGELYVRDGAIFKLYGRDERDVARQTRVQRAAMLNRLNEAGLNAFVTGCVVLPDYKVGNAQIVSMQRDHIIDAIEFDSLGTRVREFLARGHGQSDCETLRRFLTNEFQVSLDLRLLGDQVRLVSRRLADGLATWVPRISAPSGAIRIRATAGSGKTHLALRLLNDTAVSELRALYVCFNRILADHIGRIAPPKAKITSFHELCVDHWRQTSGEPDFAAIDVFQVISERYCENAPGLPPRFDLIIIDEGQDFEPAWVASLLPQLKDDGRIFLLEDDAQRLYTRDAFDLADAVVLTCRDNFRSPRAIVEVINALRLADCTIDPRNPYVGNLPNFRTYSNEATLKRQTVRAVRSLVEQGITLEEIVVLSGHGHTKSLLLKEERLGDWSLRRFMGKYSSDGEPIWTSGILAIESVYPWKPPVCRASRSRKNDAWYKNGRRPGRMGQVILGG